MDRGSPCNMILELPLGLLNDVLVTIVTRLTNHKTSQHCVQGGWEEWKRGRKEERKRGRVRVREAMRKGGRGGTLSENYSSEVVKEEREWKRGREREGEGRRGREERRER